MKKLFLFLALICTFCADAQTNSNEKETKKEKSNTTLLAIVASCCVLIGTVIIYKRINARFKQRIYDRTVLESNRFEYDKYVNLYRTKLKVIDTAGELNLPVRKLLRRFDKYIDNKPVNAKDIIDKINLLKEIIHETEEDFTELKNNMILVDRARRFLIRIGSSKDIIDTFKELCTPLPVLKSKDKHGEYVLRTNYQRYEQLIINHLSLRENLIKNLFEMHFDKIEAQIQEITSNIAEISVCKIAIKNVRDYDAEKFITTRNYRTEIRTYIKNLISYCPDRDVSEQENNQALDNLKDLYHIANAICDDPQEAAKQYAEIHKKAEPYRKPYLAWLNREKSIKVI